MPVNRLVKNFILGSIWLALGIPAMAQHGALQLTAALENATTTNQKVQAYQALFFYYQYIKPDSAIFYVRDGQTYFSGKKDDVGVATMITLMAQLDLSQGRMDQSRTKYNEALAVFEKAGNKPGIANVNSALGVLDGKQERYKDASARFLKSLRLYEQLNDTDGIATVNMRIGILNERTGMLENALQYYNKALVLAERKPNIKGADKVVLNNNIGIIYGRMRRMKEALPYFMKALEGSKSPEKMGVRILTLNNLGIVYARTGNNKEALKYLDEALALTKSSALTEEYARVVITRSSVLSATDPGKALSDLKEALELIRPLKMQSLEEELYDEMVDVYEKGGDYRGALATLKSLRVLEDSMQSLEMAKEVMNLQTVHELENTNARLSLAEEKSKAEKKVRNIIIVVGGLLGVMFVALLLQYRRATRLYSRLKKRERELERSNEMKDKLFSIIGHDLRGPIRNLLPMLELLDGNDLTDEERRFVMDSLLTHTKASTETLDKLLFWGQAQLKGVTINVQAFDVAETIHSNLSLMQISARQKQISVVTNIPEALVISADPTHFDFVIRNLLSNAVKFTRVGGTITVGATLEEEPGFVTFYVQDNGVGIDKDRIGTLFETIGASTRGTADEKGTSIGLMLCKEYVQQNGGRISVSSEPGNGATFSFTMKLA